MTTYTSAAVYEYISEQTNDPIVERKICAISGERFAVYQSDLDFYKKISPVFDGVTYTIPTPTLCPEERQRRRMMFRNERKLYRSKCDATGETIISMYDPANRYKVYNQQFWWSDQRDPLIYGRDFDFDRTFTEQFQELLLEVPRCNLLTDYNMLENSPYVNLAGPCKNCHMIIETDRCEGCLYGYTIYDCNYCVDNNTITDSQICHESTDIKKGYRLQYCQHCLSCSDCISCVNCRNISHCFGCRNLHSGQYMIYNKQYSKEQYEKLLSELIEKDLALELKKVEKKAFYKNMSVIGNDGFVAGNHISNSKNILFGYDVDDCKNCKYCTIIHKATDCMDYVSRGLHSSMVYEAQNSGNALTQSMFCDFVWDNCDHILYSELCVTNCSHLFGCVGVRGKEYCILNKQYSKEEYEALVPKIIEHMRTTGERGEFFDPSLSAFGYNETAAQDYFSLSRDAALARGYRRQDTRYDATIPADIETVDRSADGVDEMLDGFSDDHILKKIFICKVSGKPYRIIKQELDFYRKYGIALPCMHPDVRHEQRLSRRSDMSLHLRTCDESGDELLSVYLADSPLRVYGPQIYEQHIDN